MHPARFVSNLNHQPLAARAWVRPSAKPASAILAALVAASALFATPACGKKNESPSWAAPAESAAPALPSAPPPTAKPGKKRPSVGNAVPAVPATTGLRFMAYNVKNWLTMDRTIDRTELKATPKPAAEKRAVIQLLIHHAPDAVGICEIGTREDLAEIQAELKTGGLDLAHSYYTGGGDELRHLGLLSRFPITRTAMPAALQFKLNGTTFIMNRGILDATIEVHGKPFRLLGVHLKSKRDVAQGDQEAIRRNEAGLLRQHVDSILKADPAARLIVYGDFNDTWGSAALKTITGTYTDPSYLTAIRAEDHHGAHWTHYWELHDIYSRFDFIAVSRTLKPDTDFKNSYIVDDPEWIEASDHRPLLAIFN